MPEIPVVQHFPGEDAYPPEEWQGYEDMLFAPQIPEKVIEEEKTPEQLRLEGFHGEALSMRESYAGPSGGRYSIAMDDVCKFGHLILPDGRQGPRHHTVIGKNCPHGLLDTLERDDIELTDGRCNPNAES